MFNQLQLLRRFRHFYPTFSRSHYAEATTDTAFKQMLSPGLDSDKSILISFLNAFVPTFRENPVREIKEMPVALPAIRKEGEKHTFMDVHVVSDSGTHYIIEMQARRHIMFDERALYYASSTFSRQLSETQLAQKTWYHNLMPVIALQILDYDSDRITGMEAVIPDTLLARVRAAPIKKDQFIKHYLLTDRFSGQVIECLQMVQVELPRAERMKKLSPPLSTFTEQEWWLSILLHAKDYTTEKIEKMRSDKVMPEVIYRALMRLDLKQWNPEMVTEYTSNILDRKDYATVLAVEREEGEKIGEEKGIIKGEKNEREKLILSMFENNMQLEQIALITEKRC